MAIDVEKLHGRRASDRWNRVSVGDILERVTWSTPDRPALAATPDAVADPRFASLTYAEADAAANQIAQGLMAKGLPRSSRVALFCENSVEAYLCKLGVAKAGMVVVPINVMMARDVVAEMLRHVEARAVIVDSHLWQDVEDIVAEQGIELLATIGDPDALPAGHVSFAQFLDASTPDEPDVEIHGDDIWEILLTSGTTSRPKAVMISHTYSYMASMSYALTFTRGLNDERQLTTLTPLPVVFHVGDHAFVLPSLMCGGTAVLGRRPEPVAIATAVTRHGITGLWAGSPQLLKGVVKTLDEDPMPYDLASLTVVMYGWGSVPPGLFSALRRHAGSDVRLVGLFGQTEAIACHRFRPDLWPELYRRTAPQVNYVGQPNPMLASTLVDPNGDSVLDRPGTVGEAVYRSPVVMAGYYRDEDATRQAFRDGWFHSGDAATVGEQSLRIMVDRYKDIVKSGGENVSSIRVEAVILQHPAVASAAVIGVPDDTWGEMVTAAVTLLPEAEVSQEEIIVHCRERLAGFETPKRVRILHELPTTVGGKVQKHQLREQLEEQA